MCFVHNDTIIFVYLLNILNKRLQLCFSICTNLFGRSDSYLDNSSILAFKFCKNILHVLNTLCYRSQAALLLGHLKRERSKFLFRILLFALLCFFFSLIAGIGSILEALLYLIVSLLAFSLPTPYINKRIL